MFLERLAALVPASIGTSPSRPENWGTR
jgi:hypothetical protein